MNDWTTFRKRITVHAEPEIIFRALSTQDGLESWFLRIAEFSDQNGVLKSRDNMAVKGYRYSWAWHGWGDEVNQRGSVLDSNGKDFFQFTFHDPMIVSVFIFRERETNLVELVQSNIPLDENSRRNYFVGCGEGWTFYLANLKSVLEGGLDLRNKNVDIKNVVNS
jgi:uncharacterized protein YndB with AHSA1/START domain